MPAANDISVHETDFPDLQARRAWIASLPEKADPVLAWPTAERLARKDPAAARLLVSYSRLMNPIAPTAANDNAAPTAADMRREIRPSISELMEAADSDLILTFDTRQAANTGWAIRTEGGRPVAFVGEDVRIGSLVHRHGKLVQYGQTSRGKPLSPRDRPRSPRGSARQVRSRADVRFLVANDNVPVAKGAMFLAGIKGKRGNTTRPDIGEHDAAAVMINRQARETVRLALGLHADVLDAAISDASAREIGEAFGHCGKTAERRGIAAISAALEKFAAIAA